MEIFLSRNVSLSVELIPICKSLEGRLWSIFKIVKVPRDYFIELYHKKLMLYFKALKLW